MKTDYSAEERVARICHEVNRAYCESLGDESQLPWDKAPGWQKASALSGVVFHLGKPDSKPSDSHENWMKEKLEQGWTYGEVKDVEKKTHPCLLPYEQLPVAQQTKDKLFIAVVRAAVGE